MTQIAVQCEQISKLFSHTPAVRNVSLAVNEGEILALLGPSGCGKTTTMRLIAGFERPDSGRIAIGGKEVVGPSGFTPPEKRQVGMVFQNYALFPHMTVAANVAYGLPRTSVAVTQVEAMLELVGLAGMGKRMPHELSGGQQQRVALARALAPQPQVLLLDEPFSGLDESLRDQVRGEVARILRESKATVIVVTHNQDEALFLGDRVAVMNAGFVEQVAKPEDLYLTPASRFVAEFMGSAFFFTGRIQPDGLATELGFWAQPTAGTVGHTVEVAARPDDLTLIANERGDARIIESTYRGGSYLYNVRLPSGTLVRCEGNHSHYYAPGTAVQVELTPGHPLAYFPISSGKGDAQQ